VFFRFAWQHRRELVRYLKWAGRNSDAAGSRMS
jgi:hypothetical protein